ncbi:tetratricopeptide repeat protein [Pannonibacter phragmitetus]|uniref:tetratricopeptide repeat protein n=1 Tax=Pannonibacter phragmitetus TaxID=121719 RepID=UPI003D2EA9C8
MRILRNLVQIAGLQLMLLVPAHAFDGTPASNEQITPERMTASEALRLGARKYYSGDKQAAVDSLRYAAENGQPMAAWKLGQMYAAGDGVAEDDYKAFEYYNQVVTLYGDESPTSSQAPFVSSAFVALGKYYMTGIKNTQVKANPARARQIFTHAASYFGDAEAQYELGQIYRENNDLMAVRWFNLAALKGHIGAQALLGETLFNLADSLENRERGLMWMTIARAHAAEEGVGDLGWVVEMQERYFSLASEDIRRSAARRADAWLAKHEPMRVPAAEALSAATLR